MKAGEKEVEVNGKRKKLRIQSGFEPVTFYFLIRYMLLPTELLHSALAAECRISGIS